MGASLSCCRPGNSKAGDNGDERGRHYIPKTKHSSPQSCYSSSATSSADDHFSDTHSSEISDSSIPAEYTDDLLVDSPLAPSNSWIPKPPPIPHNEQARLENLTRHRLFDSSAADSDFDDLVLIARSACSIFPVASISFVMSDKEVFKSVRGMDVKTVPREHSLAAHAILYPRHTPFLIEDTLEDDRFIGSSLVLGTYSATKIRSYVGIPIYSEENFALGVLAIMSPEPLCAHPSQLQALKMVTRQVEQKLAFRRAMHRLSRSQKELQRKNQALLESKEELKHLFGAFAFGLRGHVASMISHTDCALLSASSSLSSISLQLQPSASKTRYSSFASSVFSSSSSLPGSGAPSARASSAHKLSELAPNHFAPGEDFHDAQQSKARVETKSKGMSSSSSRSSCSGSDSEGESSEFRERVTFSVAPNNSESASSMFSTVPSVPSSMRDSDVAEETLTRDSSSVSVVSVEEFHPPQHPLPPLQPVPKLCLSLPEQEANSFDVNDAFVQASSQLAKHAQASISRPDSLRDLKHEIPSSPKQYASVGKSTDVLSKLQSDVDALNLSALELTISHSSVSQVPHLSSIMLNSLKSIAGELVASLCYASFVSHLIEDAVQLEPFQATPSNNAALKLTPRRVNIHTILDRLMLLHRGLAAKYSITLQFVCESSDDLPLDGDAWLAVLDESKIEHALNYVLTDAVNYSPPGSVVRVSLAISGDDFLIEINDSGPGISEDELSAFFNRIETMSPTPLQRPANYSYHQSSFYGQDGLASSPQMSMTPELLKQRQVQQRTHSYDSPENRKIGVELCIARSIIHGHSGDMWCEASHNWGCSFFVLLPKHREEVNEHPASSRSVSPHADQQQQHHREKSYQTPENEQLVSFQSIVQAAAASALHQRSPLKASPRLLDESFVNTSPHLSPHPDPHRRRSSDSGLASPSGNSPRLLPNDDFHAFPRRSSESRIESAAQQNGLYCGAEPENALPSWQSFPPAASSKKSAPAEAAIQQEESEESNSLSMSRLRIPSAFHIEVVRSRSSSSSRIDDGLMFSPAISAASPSVQVNASIPGAMAESLDVEDLQ